MKRVDFYKLEIFLPQSCLPALQQALERVDAGHIGRYDRCLSYSYVTSCWRPLEGAEPCIGQVGEVSETQEIKAEVTCRAERVEETIQAIREIHPYEEPVINVIPLYRIGI